jgi:hypothetical protein
VNSNTRIRAWSAKTNVAIIFASIAAVLVTAALLTAFAVNPPALAWVGFGTASVVVVAITAAATLVVPRMRVTPQRPAAPVDHEPRALVVADSDCSAVAVCDEIEAQLTGVVAVHLVVPVRVSHLHFLANDESEERRDAEQMMSIAVAVLRQRGIPASGSVGSDKPLESMTDALAAFPATEVLLVTPPEEESYWLERDLLGKARALTELAVTHVVVPSAMPAACDGLEQVIARVAHQTHEKE